MKAPERRSAFYRLRTRRYTFHCPVCDERGELELDTEDEGTFGCAGECGATFLEAKGLAGWQIYCVVKPVMRGKA